MQWFTKFEADYKELMHRFESGGRLGDFKAKMTSASKLAGPEPS
jgi:hypothetical protein